jgi:predicted metal-binding integral membrane protein DUF2182
VLNYWRDGGIGAFLMGLRYGSYCLGCCRFLMTILFEVGVMNLVWIAALSLFVLAEKIIPGGFWVAKVAGGFWLLGLAGWYYPMELRYRTNSSANCPFRRATLEILVADSAISIFAKCPSMSGK